MDKRGKKVKGQLQAGANRGQFRAAQAGNHRHQGQEAEHPVFLAASASPTRMSRCSPATGDHDESRSAIAAIVRNRGARAFQSIDAALLMEIKAISKRAAASPRHSVRHPLYFDGCSAIWWGPVNRRHSGRGARTAGGLQGKNPRIKSNQVGAVLPRFHYRGGVCHHRRDHDFRDPGVQGLVQQLWRRPAGADMVVMAISDFFVQWWWAIFGAVGGSSMPAAGMETLAQGADVHGPGVAQIADFWRSDRKSHHPRAGPAPWPPCSPPACRWSKRWNRVGGASGNQYSSRRPIKSVAKYRPARRSRRRCRIRRFPNMVLQMAAIGEESGALDSMLGKVPILRGRSG